MKIIKLIYSIAFVLLCQAVIGQSQEVTIPFSNQTAPKKLKINVSAGTVKIKGSNRSDIFVKYMVTNDDEEKEKDPKVKNGMKKISGSNFSFEMGESNNTAYIESANWFKPMDLDIEVPSYIAIEIESNMGENVEVTGTTGSINVECNMGSVVLKNISGIANVSSNVGSIKVEFASIPDPTSMLFSTTMGDVDITLPATFKADLKLKTNWGEVYSDLDIVAAPTKPKLEKKEDGGEFKVFSDSWTNATLNGGGPALTLKTQMGDIYLRKK